MSGLDRLMLDHSPHIMLLVEPREQRIVIANRTAQLALGYAEDVLLAMRITDIESSLQDVFYWEDVSSGQYLAVEVQEGMYQCAGDKMLTVMKSIQILEYEGATLLLVQATDVQSEREVEDTLAQTLSQLQATLESTGNGILVVDWQGRIASMNRLLSKMWAIPEELLLAAQDGAIFDFMAGGVLETELCRERLSDIVAAQETEDLFQLRDGRFFECVSRPQYLGERIIGRVFGFNDITERKLAEAALRDSRDQLEARVRSRTADLQTANATLKTEQERQTELIGKLAETQNQLLQSEKMATIGQLAAGVAHEINNPVSFVNSNLGALKRYTDGMLQLLAAYAAVEGALSGDMLGDIKRLKQEIDVDFLNEDIGSLLAESLDGLQRVKNIVQDLKDFSHVDESERQWADLEAGMESTLRVVWNELKYKADVQRDYAKIPQIECLPSQLNQVFMNLLVNASHAIAERGVITIRTGHDGDAVWVEVEDSGGGIAPANLGRIFDPFFTTKPIGKGTGLGLSLSYGIVQKHGGRIEVKSELGKGSAFRVILPRLAVKRVAAEPDNADSD
ncbi:MAG TPA: histidine kinase [Janthinobacterium sp.]|nr:histidine kinase [Janthinobacterium sp.]